MPKGVNITQIGRVSVGASSVFAEAKARGAVGVLFLTASDPKADWTTMQSANLVRREIDPVVPSAYAAPPITSLLLARPAMEALLAGDRVDAATLLARGEKGDYPRPFQLARRIRVHVPLASVASERPFNVVAMIEGSDPDPQAAVRDDRIASRRRRRHARSRRRPHLQLGRRQRHRQCRHAGDRRADHEGATSETVA